jgi:uncharacterized protein YndB with AHSA1/START domain
MCPGDATSAGADSMWASAANSRIVMKSPERGYVHTGEYQTVDPPSKLVFLAGATAMMANRPRLLRSN